MLELTYDYATCVRNSEKISWRVDEVLPPDTRLDFTRPFLPEALSGDSHAPTGCAYGSRCELLSRGLRWGYGGSAAPRMNN